MTESKGSRRGRPLKSEVATITPRILAAATDVFLHAGYDQANMADVAQKAGCSKRTLYLRFASKLDLFSAFVQFFIEERLEGVRISVDPSASLEQQLVRVLAGIRNFALSDEAFQLHRLIVQDGRRFPELRSIMEEAAWKPGSSIIKELLESHIPGPTEAEMTFLAEQFLALAALRPIHHNIVGKLTPLEPPEQVVKLFLRGCCSFAISARETAERF